MTTPLIAKIREEARFISRKSILGLRSAEFQMGRSDEHTRLEPLIEMLIQLVEDRERLQLALEEINEGTASALEDMQHYFENKCCPTMDEVNEMSTTDSQVRYAIAKTHQIDAELLEKLK